MDSLSLGGVSCSGATLVGGVKCKDVGVEQSSLGMPGARERRSDYGRPDEWVKHPVKQTLASFKGERNLDKQA